MTKHVVVGVSEFKAQCLRLLDDVSKRRVHITVTKRGRPIAQVASVPAETTSAYGSMKGSIVIRGDLTAPTGEVWNAEQD